MKNKHHKVSELLFSSKYTVIKVSKNQYKFFSNVSPIMNLCVKIQRRLTTIRSHLKTRISILYFYDINIEDVGCEGWWWKRMLRVHLQEWNSLTWQTWRVTWEIQDKEVFKLREKKSTIKGFVVATCSSNQDNATKCWTLMMMMMMTIDHNNDDDDLMMTMMIMQREHQRMMKQCGRFLCTKHIVEKIYQSSPR